MRTHLGVTVVSHTDESGVFGATHPDDAARLAHLNTVTAEWVRLRIAHPNMATSPVHTFYVTKDERGRCIVPALSPEGTHVKMSTKSAEWTAEERKKIATWEEKHSLTFTTERQGTQIADNFRHELGHALTTEDSLKDYNATVPAPTSDEETQKDQTSPLEWARKHLSNYAAKNERESFAEAFGIFTRSEYVAGTLPAKMEAFFRTLLGNQSDGSSTDSAAPMLAVQTLPRPDRGAGARPGRRERRALGV